MLIHMPDITYVMVLFSSMDNFLVSWRLLIDVVAGSTEAAMEGKRPHNDLDPDYEDVGDQQNKRQRLLEHDGMSHQADMLIVKH